MMFILIAVSAVPEAASLAYPSMSKYRKLKYIP